MRACASASRRAREWSCEKNVLSPAESGGLATGGQASAAPDDRPAVSPGPGQPASGDRRAARRLVSPGKQRLHREHYDGENRMAITGKSRIR